MAGEPVTIRDCRETLLFDPDAVLGTHTGPMGSCGAVVYVRLRKDVEADRLTNTPTGTGGRD